MAGTTLDAHQQQMGNKCKDSLSTRSTCNDLTLETSRVTPVSQKKSLHMSRALFAKAQSSNDAQMQLLKEECAGRRGHNHRLMDSRVFITDTRTDSSSSTSHLSPTEDIQPTRLLQRLLPVNMSRPTIYIELNKELHEVESRFTASDGELLHRISIVNMAYYVKGERRVDALIEFDSSYFEGAERSGVSASVKGDLPVSVLKPPMVSDVSDEPSASTSLCKAANTCEDNSDICYRSRTMPFMAIEALDLKLSPYIHDLCHDLESLFYATVWHGVGYKRSKGNYSYASGAGKNKNEDILRGWIVGSWKVVVMEKNTFLFDAEDILPHVKHPDLAEICWNLATLFGQRVQAVRNRARVRKSVAKATLRQQAVKRRVISFVYNQPVFPFFADLWGFNRVTCQNSCCVTNPP